MNSKDTHSNHFFVGKRLLHDVFNRSGVLLIAASTLLDRQHIQLLQGQSIRLSDKDVEFLGPYRDESGNTHAQAVDEAIDVMGHLFENIRYLKRIPVAEIRKQVIPVIQSITDQPNLFDLFAALRTKDDYLYRHHFAVGVISNLLGKWMGLNEIDLLQLTTSALLHDVGKTQIPLELLNKNESLNDEEYVLMKKHTVFGHDMLRNTVGITRRQALAALQHHERMDGSGYPHGIRDQQIDLFSRIVAVADVFHAMSSEKVYRTPCPFYEVLQQMDRSAFGAFDPAIVYLLINKNMQALFGYDVLLSDGTSGKIVLINPHDHLRPLVQSGDSFIDLSKQPDLHIHQVLSFSA